MSKDSDQDKPKAETPVPAAPPKPKLPIFSTNVGSVRGTYDGPTMIAKLPVDTPKTDSE